MLEKSMPLLIRKKERVGERWRGVGEREREREKSETCVRKSALLIQL